MVLVFLINVKTFVQKRNFRWIILKTLRGVQSSSHRFIHTADKSQNQSKVLEKKSHQRKPFPKMQTKSTWSNNAAKHPFWHTEQFLVKKTTSEWNGILCSHLPKNDYKYLFPLQETRLPFNVRYSTALWAQSVHLDNHLLFLTFLLGKFIYT